MEEKEKEIIQQSMQVFMRLGIKSVNMDDIAKNLGISKKTLYKYVSDKEDLLKKVMNLHCDMEDSAICSIQRQSFNAIEETFEMTRFIHGMLQNVHPSVMFDLEKYHPSLMNKMKSNRQEQIQKCIVANLKKGMDEGLYREDLNPEVISRVYVLMVNGMMKGEILAEENMSMARTYLEFIRYHIRGIANEKGLEFLAIQVEKERERIDIKTSLADL